MQRILAALRLIRAPNTLTAAADVFAGRALSGRNPFDLEGIGLAIGSAALYAGGIALNDLADLKKDRSLHPERPLPRGDLSPRAAIALTTGLLLLGMASSFLGGWPTFALTTLLVASIVGYDFLPDGQVLLGVVLMGACRATNLLRGASSADSTWLEGPPLVAACAHFALVCAITWVSTCEDRQVSRRFERAGVIALLLSYLAPGILALFTSTRGILTLGISLPLAIFVVIPGFLEGGSPRAVVMRAVFSLSLLNALYVLANRGFQEALIVAALFPLSRLIARGLRQTGS